MPDLLEVRPAEAILQALEAFHWKGDNRENGWGMRESLSESLIAALDADDSAKLSEALADILRGAYLGAFQPASEADRRKSWSCLSESVETA